LGIFLERGFEQTTMEEIATSVGMSKRTVYARFDDKSALFNAAVMQAIERYTVPLETLRAAEALAVRLFLNGVRRRRSCHLWRSGLPLLQPTIRHQTPASRPSCLAERRALCNTTVPRDNVWKVDPGP
jgi:AcrR family transcriptional regulator